MTKNLKIAALQTSLFWENAEANRAMFEEKLAAIAEPVDLIVLPEMFTTGFSMKSNQLAEPALLHTHKWMHMMAQQKNALVLGSYIVQEKGHFYNRLLAMEPSGAYHCYDKRHLFRMGGENEFYSAGADKVIISWRGVNIRPLICYDLRFPVWSRNVANDYDLLLYVANWPAPRAHVWRALLMARALENQCYVVGVNRVGTDGEGLNYAGDSMIIDYKGNILANGFEQEVSLLAEINLTDLQDFRQKFPAYLDADSFEIKL